MEGENNTPPPETPSGPAVTAIAEEVVLNAAVAFAGQVAAAAQEAGVKTGRSAPPALQETIVRQFYLETATLCLCRLGESYNSGAEGADDEEIAQMLRDGAERAAAARATVEALGDLGLDLMDRLLER